ncbi:calmodulin-lysine N-methyltransferase [Macadamia integrifolia]|uniref:calmodulin-lysine N-methyltransferase n=1 Tax=Macadamia integrifolia TaxID=60698 RepID=UPI001C4E74BC|nr:calmodulin-lysine N-methyltransferase [Macadamia integrifolia]
MEEKNMEKTDPSPWNSRTKTSSMRWGILRQAFLRCRADHPDYQSQSGIEHISRKTSHGFNLISCQLINDGLVPDASGSSLKMNNLDGLRDTCMRYTLPLEGAPSLVLIQRVENYVDFNEFETCNKFEVDNTGLVCRWPSEDVLAYFCLSYAEKFRSKRILELGSGYGLAGLVIAAGTDALEVVISDGNPLVVDYIQRNINANCGALGDTNVKSMTLHWNQDQVSCNLDPFDIIVASDCTFFKEFHEGLAQTVKSLLKQSGTSEAIFFSPKRGDSLDKFLQEVEEIGLHYSVTENYNGEVWKRHLRFLSGDYSWPNYEKDHCYPLLVRITF